LSILHGTYLEKKETRKRKKNERKNKKGLNVMNKIGEIKYKYRYIGLHDCV
jgi:hypothetical protein